jgi:hypothetical protein
MMVAPVWARTELEPHRLERCRGAYLRFSYEALAEPRERGFKALRLEEGYPNGQAV